MLRVARAPLASVDLVLLLVVVFIVRAVLLHCFPLPSVGVSDPDLVPTKPDENLPKPEPLPSHDADACSRSAPFAENAAPLVPRCRRIGRTNHWSVLRRHQGRPCEAQRCPSEMVPQFRPRCQ
jgi:hypothetical protein